MTDEPTNHLNAGAARAAASALAGGSCWCWGLLSMPFLALLPASHPLAVPSWLLTLSGKILCYAIVAVALDLVWGYAGMLSLGHGIFFALGGYAMGMYLMRQAAGDGLPAFMSFLSWSELLLVLVGHAAFRLGDGAGSAGSRSAGPGFRLVCLSLEDQRGSISRS